MSDAPDKSCCPLQGEYGGKVHNRYCEHGSPMQTTCAQCAECDLAAARAQIAELEEMALGIKWVNEVTRLANLRGEAEAQRDILGLRLTEARAEIERLTSVIAEMETIAQQQAVERHVREKELEMEIERHHRKFDLLQKEQTRFRDPERTIVCDIIANGSLLPVPSRYEIRDEKDAEIERLKAKYADTRDARRVMRALRDPHVKNISAYEDDAVVLSYKPRDLQTLDEWERERGLGDIDAEER